jgi:hypothetical protein
MIGPGVVSHTCNPSYLGGTDDEEHGSMPAGQKVTWASSQQQQQQIWVW